MSIKSCSNDEDKDDPPKISKSCFLDREIGERFGVEWFRGRNVVLRTIEIFVLYVIVIHHITGNIGTSNAAESVREENETNLES